MAKEIEDGEYDTLVRAKNLLNEIWNDGEHGMAFKKMLKSKYKDAKIPEIDIVEQAKKPLEEKLSEHEKRMQSIQDRMDKKEKDELSRKEESELEKDLADARKKYSLTDEGFEKVIKRMKDKKSLDAEAAAAWVASQEPKAKPAGESKIGLPGKANLFGSSKKDESWAELNKNPMDWFDKEVTSIMEKPEDYKEFGGNL